MRDGDAAWHWVTGWAQQVGGVVWVRGPGGDVRYLNARAESLLGCTVQDLEGLPCHRAVAARGADDRPFCSPLCPLLRRARNGIEIPPVDLCIERQGQAPQWLRLVAFAFGDGTGSGPYVVHCGVGIDVEHDAVDFVRRIASRSHDISAGGGAAQAGEAAAKLTPREREILQLLTADRSVDAIALELHVSPVTVRNHVQHILSKLGTHSILEAAALHILTSHHDS